MMKNFLLVMVFCLSLSCVAVHAQDIQTKGSISGMVVDVNEAVVQQLLAKLLLSTYHCQSGAS
jgi:hypothetical protein